VTQKVNIQRTSSVRSSAMRWSSHPDNPGRSGHQPPCGRPRRHRVALGGGPGWHLARCWWSSRIALSLTLLVGTGMPVRSTRALGSVDPELARDRLLIVTVDAAPTGLEGERLAQVARTQLGRLRALPGLRRTGEFGIRMALGAEAAQVGLMVLGEAMMLVAGGVVVGVPLALVGTRLLRSQLFGVGRWIRRRSRRGLVCWRSVRWRRDSCWRR
jgi:hypothetical protein